MKVKIFDRSGNVKSMLTIKQRYFKLLPLMFFIVFHSMIYYRLLFTSASNLLYLEDIYIPFLSRGANTDYFVSAWHPHFLGVPGYSPLITPLTDLLVKLLDSFVLAQRLIAFLPLFISSLTMYIFLSKSNFVKSMTMRTLASIVYSSNWVTFESLSQTGLMYEYAFMPLIMLFAMRIFTNHKRVLYNSLGLAFSLASASIFYYAAVFHALIVIIPLFFSSIIIKHNQGKSIIRELPRFSLGVCTTFLFYVLFTLPTSFFFLRYMMPSGGLQTLESIGRTIIYEPLNTVWYHHEYPYVISPLLVLSSPMRLGLERDISSYLGFSIPLIITVPLFSRDKIKKITSILFLIALLMITGIIWLAIKENSISTFLYRNLIILQALREPPRWFFVLSPILSVLTALGLDKIWHCMLDLKIPATFAKIYLTKRFIRSQKTMTRIFGAVLITIIAYSTVFSHNYLILNIEEIVKPRTSFSKQGGRHETYYGYIPSYLIKLSEKIDELRAKEGFFRVFWVPADGTIFNGGLNVLDPTANFFPPKNEFLQQYVVKMVALMSKRKISSLGCALSLIGIKYIVVLKTNNHTTDIGIHYWFTGPRYIIGRPSDFIKLFNNQSDLTLVENEREYMIYRNEAFMPMIFGSYESVILSNQTSLMVIRDDDHANFWTPYGVGPGNWRIASLTDEPLEKTSGTNSGKVIVEDGGRYAHPILAYDYGDEQDWSSYDLFSIYLYGANTTRDFSILCGKDTGTHYYSYRIDDNWLGWKEFKIPLETFKKHGILTWANIRHVRLYFPAARGTWYFDNITLVGGWWRNVNCQLNSIITQLEASNTPQIRLLNCEPHYFPSKFTIKVNTSKPACIVLSQNYDPSWHAYAVHHSGDKSELQHAKALGWANAYYIPQDGIYRIEIIFEEQYMRDAQILVWVITTSLSLVLFMILGLTEWKQLNTSNLPRFLKSVISNVKAHLRKTKCSLALSKNKSRKTHFYQIDSVKASKNARKIYEMNNYTNPCIMDCLTEILLSNEINNLEIDVASFNGLLKLSEKNRVTYRFLLKISNNPKPKEKYCKLIQKKLIKLQKRINEALNLTNLTQKIMESYGIHFVIIKTFDHYPDIGDDIDVLVYENDLKVAERALWGMPIRPLLQSKGFLGLEFHKKEHFLFKLEENYFDVELYPRFTTFGERYLSEKDIISRARHSSIRGLRVLVPSPEDALLIACIHTVYRHGGKFRLSEVYNVMKMLRKENLNWNRIFITAKNSGTLVGLLYFLGLIDSLCLKYSGQSFLPDEISNHITSYRVKDAYLKHFPCILSSSSIFLICVYKVLFDLRKHDWYSTFKTFQNFTFHLISRFLSLIPKLNSMLGVR